MNTLSCIHLELDTNNFIHLHPHTIVCTNGTIRSSLQILARFVAGAFTRVLIYMYMVWCCIRKNMWRIKMNNWVVMSKSKMEFQKAFHLFIYAVIVFMQAVDVFQWDIHSAFILVCFVQSEVTNQLLDFTNQTLLKIESSIKLANQNTLCYWNFRCIFFWIGKIIFCW